MRTKPEFPGSESARAAAKRVLKKRELVIAVPNKGRMQGPCFQLLEDVGIKAKPNGDRQLIVPTSEPGVKLLLSRMSDIPLMLERGAADIGFTGKDCVAERGSKVDTFLDLDFGVCKVALAAPRGVRKPESIATALPNITAGYCRKRGWNPEIVKLEGALESAPRLGIAQAIVDQVETGITLAENKLRVIDVIMESRMCIIGVNDSFRGSGLTEPVITITMLAQGRMDARMRMLLKVNAADAGVRDVLVNALPAMKSPNVTPLAGGGFSLEAAVPRKGYEALVVKLRKLGGTDIVVSDIKMLVA